MEKYSLTDEHREQLEPWAKKWIANARETRGRLTEEERKEVIEHIRGLYEAADLTPPPDHRIVIVPSPFVARFAAGYAAGVWHKRCMDAAREATYNSIGAATDRAIRDAILVATRTATSIATYATTDDATRDAINAATDKATNAATEAATDDATREATREATEAATDDATREATIDATYAATHAATYAATSDATNAATSDATDDATEDAISDAIIAATSDATYAATYDATYAATYDATESATYDATESATIDAKNGNYKNWYRMNGDPGRLASKFGNRDFFLGCASKAYRLYQAGSDGSSWCSYISFFRHIAKLEIDYSKWAHYERLAELTELRYMHEKFCIVCEKPVKMQVDDDGLGHCEDGPYKQWADGSCLYQIHSVKVPAWVVEFPEAITPEKINEESNAEVRRIMMERYGVARYLTETNAKIIDADGGSGVEGSAPRMLVEDSLGDRWFFCTDGSTERCYHMPAFKWCESVKEFLECVNGLDETNLISEA